MAEEATPQIVRSIARRANVVPGPHGRFSPAGSLDALDAEDATSLARQRIWRRLVDPAHPGVIADFRSYCARIALHAWSDMLHLRYPARRGIIHRMRYLVEGKSAQREGFALWFVDGQEVAGRRADRDRAEPGDDAAVRAISEHAAEFLQQHLPGVDVVRLDAARLLERILAALGAPVFWADLVEILGALWEANGGRSERSVESAELERAETTASAAPSPADQLDWREHLRWLWQALLRLKLPQRTAFLLHANVTHEFEYRAIASLRGIAEALAITPLELAELWSDIPLDDLTIAARLGLQRQQVINLRKAARVALGQKLLEYQRS